MVGSLHPDSSAWAARIDEQLAQLGHAEIPRRIRDRDHTVWREDPTEISNRLGWLDVISEMRGRLGEIHDFVGGLRKDGVKDVVLLGMGGSSLAPEVFRQILGGGGAARLHVLDSTAPAWIRSVEESLDPATTAVLVASKSGSTLEVRTLRERFREWLRPAGAPEARMFAVTDPDTALAEMATGEGWRACFLNPPDIGGRFSALSLFGLVPAGILGVDLEEMLTRAARLAAACGDDPAGNPGAWLGAAIAAAASAGHDKVVLSTPPAWASFGLWVEQLVAESTGKEGKGVVPVVGADPTVSADSIVVHAGEPARPIRADVPQVTLEMNAPIDLGAEMFRWEYATAVLGHLLDVQPFDQPDVQSAKTRTVEILEAGAPAAVTATDPRTLLGSLKAGDYVGLLVFGSPSPARDAALEALARAIFARWEVPVTIGYGPRFLHSTGQLHKGGPNSGVFLQWLLDEGELAIPGESYGFHDVLAAQAGGDLRALHDAGRRAGRVDSGADPAAGIRALAESL